MLGIIFATAAAVLTIVLAVYAYLYRKRHAKNALNAGYEDGSEGLFSGGDASLYTLFCKGDPECAVRKLGVDTERMKKNCAIAGLPYQPECLISRLAVGALLLAAGAALGFFVHWSIGVAGVLGFFLVFYIPYKRPEYIATKRKHEMIDEIPRFIDMLETALRVGLPIAEAITITAKHLKGTTIAKEFLSSVAEMQIGAYSWQQALERLADKYEIDVFSDFVMDIVTAYEKGVSVQQSVSNKNREIKLTRSLQIKSNAQRMNSTILLPITVFKLLPLLAIIGIPLFLQLQIL